MGEGAKITIEALSELIQARAEDGERLIIAIAGPPAAGKSTVAEKLNEALNAAREGLSAILPMDGFHYDDLWLVPAGLRARKGAPHTFDVGGFAHMLKRLRARDEDFVAVPVFDRSLEIARAGARMILKETPVVIAEGNYLLLNEAPWRSLRPLFDLSAMISAEESVLRERLLQRWRDHGLSEAEAVAKAEENDLPNARLVLRESGGEDFLIS